MKAFALSKAVADHGQAVLMAAYRLHRGSACGDPGAR